jgi:hypothetical protein
MLTGMDRLAWLLRVCMIIHFFSALNAQDQILPVSVEIIPTPGMSLI